MRYQQRSTLMFIAVSAALSVTLGALHGCGSSGGPVNSGGSSGGSAATTVIDAVNSVGGMGFSFVSPVTVRSGAVVQWRNQSSAPHTVVWDSQTPAASPAPGAGIGKFGPALGDLSATWTAPAVTTQTTYAYHCGIHGPTMNGVIVVNP